MKRVYLFIIASVFLCSYNYSQSGYVSFDKAVNGYDSIRIKEGTVKLKGDVFGSYVFGAELIVYNAIFAFAALYAISEAEGDSLASKDVLDS